MKKSMKPIALLLTFILVFNLPMLINASEQVIIPKHEHENLMIGTINNAISQKISNIDGKMDYNTFSKIVYETYPNAIILDKATINNLASVNEIKEMILEKCGDVSKSIDEIRITEDYFKALKSIGNADNEDIYVAIDYDFITHEAVTLITMFCIFCCSQVLVQYVLSYLPPGVDQGTMWLVQFAVETLFCTLCYQLLSETYTPEYLEPVPECGMCHQYFSYVNGNWYCYTCQVWD